MTVAEVKRKLRKLKKEEGRIRSEGVPVQVCQLVFNDFFHMKEGPSRIGGYGLRQLAEMTHVQRKEVFETYFLNVYITWIRENHLPMDRLYDPMILGKMGLDYGASESDIKKKFKELAKSYHPDAGGDGQQFIELKSLYDQLLKSDRA